MCESQGSGNFLDHRPLSWIGNGKIYEVNSEDETTTYCPKIVKSETSAGRRSSHPMHYVAIHIVGISKVLKSKGLDFAQS